MANREFLELKLLDDALAEFFALWGRPVTEVEMAPLIEAAGRVLAAPVRVGADVPGFARSIVDGYAVRAADTFGATEGVPAYLTVAGEVAMGQAADAGARGGGGRAVRMATGGMLPAGADAAVMVEHTEALDQEGREIGVTRPVAPGENVIRRGEDLAAGDELLAAGRVLSPYDIGALAGLGLCELPVRRRPRVVVISTGDEVVPPDATPGPGQVRDINGPALAAAATAAGARAVYAGIVRDVFETQREAVRGALAGADMVLISGGSSIGARDLTAQVIDSFGRPGVVLHGLAIRPGKPTIAALVGSVPMIGLPGHPASALVVFEVFVRPLLESLRGRSEWDRPWVWARLTRSLSSGAGREDFVRVRLRPLDQEPGGGSGAAAFGGRGAVAFEADPVLGKSGLISTLVKADGLLRIPVGKEGLPAGDIVRVTLL